MNAAPVPNTMLSRLHTISHLILTTTPPTRVLSPLFTEEHASRMGGLSHSEPRLLSCSFPIGTIRKINLDLPALQSREGEMLWVFEDALKHGMC